MKPLKLLFLSCGAFFIALSLQPRSWAGDIMKCSEPGGPKFKLEAKGASYQMTMGPMRLSNVKLDAHYSDTGTCHLMVSGLDNGHSSTASINFQTPSGSLKKIRTIIHSGLGEFPSFDCSIDSQYQSLASACEIAETPPAQSSSGNRPPLEGAPISSNTNMLTCHSTIKRGGAMHIALTPDDTNHTVSAHLIFYKDDGATVDRGTRAVKISGTDCHFTISEDDHQKGDKFKGHFNSSDFDESGQGSLRLESGATAGQKWDPDFLNYTCTMGDTWPSHFANCQFVWPAPGSESPSSRQSR